MIKNDFAIEIVYSDFGHVSELTSLLNKEPFGPKLTFFEGGKLDSASIEYGKRAVGTNQGWIDTGEKAWECYSAPNSQGDCFYRDYSIEFLLLEQSQPIVRRWRATEDEVLEQEFVSKQAGTVVLFDANAELEWMPTTDVGDFHPKWPAGQRVNNGEIGFSVERIGATITFWPNGAVRTIGYWYDDSVIGTRSCFSPDGRLLVEQSFHRTGFRRGTWLSRFFETSQEGPRLSRAEIYLDFRLYKSISASAISNILDEASLNRYVDPLFESLRELDLQSNMEIGEIVNWNEHF